MSSGGVHVSTTGAGSAGRGAATSAATSGACSRGTAAGAGHRPGTRLAPHRSPVAPSLPATVSRGEAAAQGWGSGGKERAGGERRPRERRVAQER